MGMLKSAFLGRTLVIDVIGVVVVEAPAIQDAYEFNILAGIVEPGLSVGSASKRVR